MSLFIGSGVALVTPLDAEGINIATLNQLIEWHIEHQTDALIVGGTTGEASTLTDAEKEVLFTEAVKAASGRIPVIAGTGSNDTAHAIALSQMAEKCGVDGLLIVTPYYNKCTQKGLIEHYKSIAAAVKCPIILYNVPSRTGLNLQPSTVAKLAHVENIIGIKEASADITQIVELFRQLESLDFDVYSGNDDHILPLLALGAKGVITTVGNVLPTETHHIVSFYNQGELELARQLQFKINPLVQALFTEVNPIPVKAAVSHLGFNVGSVRLPLTPEEPETLSRIVRELAMFS